MFLECRTARRQTEPSILIFNILLGNDFPDRNTHFLVRKKKNPPKAEIICCVSAWGLCMRESGMTRTVSCDGRQQETSLKAGHYALKCLCISMAVQTWGRTGLPIEGGSVAGADSRRNAVGMCVNNLWCASAAERVERVHCRQGRDKVESSSPHQRLISKRCIQVLQCRQPVGSLPPWGGGQFSCFSTSGDGGDVGGFE